MMVLLMCCSRPGLCKGGTKTFSLTWIELYMLNVWIPRSQSRNIMYRYRVDFDYNIRYICAVIYNIQGDTDFNVYCTCTWKYVTQPYYTQISVVYSYIIQHDWQSRIRLTIVYKLQFYHSDIYDTIIHEKIEMQKHVLYRSSSKILLYKVIQYTGDTS